MACVGRLALAETVVRQLAANDWPGSDEKIKANGTVGL